MGFGFVANTPAWDAKAYSFSYLPEALFRSNKNKKDVETWNSKRQQSLREISPEMSIGVYKIVLEDMFRLHFVLQIAKHFC